MDLRFLIIGMVLSLLFFLSVITFFPPASVSPAEELSSPAVVELKGCLKISDGKFLCPLSMISDELARIKSRATGLSTISRP